MLLQWKKKIGIRHEVSGFEPPLLHLIIVSPFLSLTTKTLPCWQKNCKKCSVLEEENNRLFVDAYGPRDELTLRGAVMPKSPDL